MGKKQKGQIWLERDIEVSKQKPNICIRGTHEDQN